MRIYIVDDEQLAINMLKYNITAVAPDAEIMTFTSVYEYLHQVDINAPDVVFMDIEMPGIKGVELAKLTSEKGSNINIIFVTGYSEYMRDAFDLFASGYILKPSTKDKIKEQLDHLRYPVEKKKRVEVKCFGNFDVLIDGQPVKFKYNKTKELLAYLVDRNGSDCTTREIMSAIFEDEDKISYYDNLRVDLIIAFKLKGLGDIIRQKKGVLGIEKSLINCDYFNYLNGNKGLFHGEYMTQYSFGEVTLQNLVNESTK